MTRDAIPDRDGTSLGTMPLWREAAARYLSGLGIKVDKALRAKFFEMTVPESAQIVRDEFNLNSMVEEITMGIYGTIAREYHDKVGLRPGMKEFIKALTRHGIPFTIVSSGSGALIRPALVRLGLRWNFMKVLASSETGLHKRQPGMFLTAVRLIGAESEDIWVFGDALYAVRVAKAAGFYSMAIRDETSLAERGTLEAKVEACREEYPVEIPAAWLR